MAAKAEPARDERVLLVSRLLDAPRPLVFRVWTDPLHLARWWGPEGFTLLACEADVRPGGTWLRRMRAPSGSLHVKRGVYREIVPPERLVFTYADEEVDGGLGHETVVTISLVEEGPRTRLTLRQELFRTVEARDSHLGGWSGALRRLADYLPTAEATETAHAT